MTEPQSSHERPQSRWDERYAGNDYHFGTQPNGFLRDSIDLLPRGRVLCIGDGEGRNSVFLAERGFDVTAMDASPVGMEKALRLARDRGVNLETRIGDLRTYDLGRNEWDAIVSVFVHLLPELRRDVHGRVAAALRPGGVFLIEAYTPEQLGYRTGGPPVEELMMTLDMLKDDLSGLNVETGRQIVRNVTEGRGHRGRAAVVQVIARKPRER